MTLASITARCTFQIDRSSLSIRSLAIMLVAAIALIATAVGLIRLAQPRSRSLYVSAVGSDRNIGDSPDKPLRTIQAALDRARPGTTIRLARGRYREEVTTK